MKNETVKGPKPLAGKAECAKFLGIKERTLDKYIATGRIPVIRLSQKIIRFDMEDVLNTLRA